MVHADFPRRRIPEKTITVGEAIEKLKKFDPNLQLVVAYDGRFAHTETLDFVEGEGRELYDWPKKDAQKKIVILDA